MRRTVLRALVTGAALSALLPLSASAQSMPSSGMPMGQVPTFPTSDQSQILAMLPGQMSSVLSADLSQINNGAASGDPSQLANDVGIFEQAYSGYLSTAEANLANDAAEVSAGSSTAGQTQVAGDQQLLNELLALNTDVLNVQSALTATQPGVQPPAYGTNGQ